MNKHWYFACRHLFLTIFYILLKIFQMNKLEKLGRAKMLIREAQIEKKESSQSSAQDSDSDDEIGPKVWCSYQ